MILGNISGKREGSEFLNTRDCLRRLAVILFRNYEPIDILPTHFMPLVAFYNPPKHYRYLLLLS